MAIQTVHGTELTIATDTWDTVYALKSFDWTGPSFEVYETTNMETSAARTFISSTTYDPGEATFIMEYDPTEATAGGELVAKNIRSIALKIGGQGTSINCEADGFITSVNRSGASDPDSGLAMIEITVKFTGALGNSAA